MFSHFLTLCIKGLSISSIPVIWYAFQTILTGFSMMRKLAIKIGLIKLSNFDWHKVDCNGVFLNHVMFDHIGEIDKT